MPRQGAAILSQIQGLMQQFLALDYDSPVKDTVQQMLPEIESGMAELSAQADSQDTETPQEAAAPGEEPDVPPMDQGPKQSMHGPMEGAPTDFASARSRGTEALKGLQAKGDGPQPADEEFKRRRAKGR